MGDYWFRVVCRAAKETRDFFGWGDLIRLAIRVSFYIGVVIVLALVGQRAQATGQLNLFVVSIVVGAILLIVVFVFKFVTTPHRIDQELRSEISLLRQQTKTRSDRHEVANRLIHLWQDGNTLFYRKPRTGVELGQWDQEVGVWYDQVDSEMKGKLPEDEVYMFKTIPPDEQNFDHRYDSNHNESLQGLHASLGKLRLIIARYLKQTDSDTG